MPLFSSILVLLAHKKFGPSKWLSSLQLVQDACSHASQPQTTKQPMDCTKKSPAFLVVRGHLHSASVVLEAKILEAKQS